MVADRATVEVYEQRAQEWQRARGSAGRRSSAAGAEADLAARTEAPGPTADLGCGPGWDVPRLRGPTIAVDVSRSMLDLVVEHAPSAPRVQADLAALPFARSGLAAAWASKSYVHLPDREVPAALAQLHAALAPGAPIHVVLFEGGGGFGAAPDDDFPGRRFSTWPRERLDDVIRGAGFDEVEIEATDDPEPSRLLVSARRSRTLPDTVGPGMRLLICGLNPSEYAADAGIGFGRPGNRFWPAALEAGLVTVDRDPHRALLDHAIGMTDLVKRATPRAAALEPSEYAQGVARVERLVAWLQPRAVCFVGLAGWRSTIDRHAGEGEQVQPFGGRPVYLMGSTSGLNANARLEDCVEHLGRAGSLADRP